MDFGGSEAVPRGFELLTNCAKSLQDCNTFAQHLRGVSETKACGQRHKSTVVTDREMLYQAAVVRGKEGLWWDMEGVPRTVPALCLPGPTHRHPGIACVLHADSSRMDDPARARWLGAMRRVIVSNTCCSGPSQTPWFFTALGLLQTRHWG